MPHKDSSKSFGMACFGCLFLKKKPSRFGKGKEPSRTSKSIPGTSKKVLGSSKRSQSSKKTRDTENVSMIELRKKIMSFRELVDLPPCIGSSTILELVRHTVKELRKLYPDVLY